MGVDLPAAMSLAAISEAAASMAATPSRAAIGTAETATASKGIAGATSAIAIAARILSRLGPMMAAAATSNVADSADAILPIATAARIPSRLKPLRHLRPMMAAVAALTASRDAPAANSPTGPAGQDLSSQTLRLRQPTPGDSLDAAGKAVPAASNGAMHRRIAQSKGALAADLSKWVRRVHPKPLLKPLRNEVVSGAASKATGVAVETKVAIEASIATTEDRCNPL
jgi:hypothetical protein